MIGSADQLLRSEGRFAIDRPQVPWRHLSLLLLTAGFAYGAAMGSYGSAPLQSLYSGLKVPLLLLISSLVCLPNFFVINTVLGLRDDFAAACRGILAAQATVALALVSLAPIMLFLYANGVAHRQAIVSNGLCFACATVAGQIALNRYYAPLIRANRRHRHGRRAWILLYVFVAVQLAWVLRPFVGAPGLPTQFFREDAWSNAYVIVIGYVGEALAGG